MANSLRLYKMTDPRPLLDLKTANAGLAYYKFFGEKPNAESEEHSTGALLKVFFKQGNLAKGTKITATIGDATLIKDANTRRAALSDLYFEMRLVSRLMTGLRSMISTATCSTFVSGTRAMPGWAHSSQNQADYSKMDPPPRNWNVDDWLREVPHFTHSHRMPNVGVCTDVTVFNWRAREFTSICESQIGPGFNNNDGVTCEDGHVEEFFNQCPEVKRWKEG